MHKSIEIVVWVLEYVASFVELHLPLNRHHAIKYAFERSFILKEFVSSRSWKIDTNVVDEPEATGGVKAVHVKRLGDLAHILLLDVKYVREHVIGQKRTSVTHKISIVGVCCSGNGHFPRSTEISTEDLAGHGMTIFVVNVERVVVAAILILNKHTDEAFLVGCIRSEGQPLFARRALVGRNICDASGWIVFVENGVLERQRSLSCSSKRCGGDHKDVTMGENQSLQRFTTSR